MYAIFYCAAAALCAASGCTYYENDVGAPHGWLDIAGECVDGGTDVETDVETDGAVVVVDGHRDGGARIPDGGIADAGFRPDAEGDDAEIPDGGSDGPAMHCDHDYECGGGACIDRMCHRACAGADAETCGTGQCCVDGLCDYDPTAPVGCVLNADCADGAVCVDGACHSSCEVDAQCADPDDFCDHGLCRPDFRPITECATRSHCDGAERCVNGLCRLACWADAECPSGSCSGGFCTE